MKLMSQALAVLAVSFVLVGCGERPLRPAKIVSGQGKNPDAVEAVSKNAVHVVTTKDLTKKFLKVKLNNETVATECAGEETAKAPEGQTYTIARESELKDFGVRGAYVTITYRSEAPMKAVKFTLIAADSCQENSQAREYVVDTNIAIEEQTANAAAKTYLGFGVVQAEI